MSDNDETIVIFRRWPESEGGDVIALFPLLAETDRLCSSYQHVGQHGSADFAYVMRVTRPAGLDEPDVQALKRELEAAPYGYRLAVRQRSPRTRRRDS